MKQETLQHRLKQARCLCCALLFITFMPLNTHAQSFEWVKGIGGGIIAEARHVAIDDNSNVYVIGNFLSGNLSFQGGTDTLTATGGYDAFLAKYDEMGNCLWARRMSGSDNEQAYDLALDASGNVYVTGYFQSSDFTLDGSSDMLSSAGSADVFLAKYDAAGNYLWAKRMGGTDHDWAFGVATDAGNNVYIAGGSNSTTADFNPGGNGGTLIGTASFIAKYDSSGNYLWAKGTDGNGNGEAHGLGIDASGNVYVSGVFTTDTIDFNPGGSGGELVKSGGFSDIFLAKYDNAGNFLWAKSMGGDGEDYDYSLAVDGSGNTYLTGWFDSDNAYFNATDNSTGILSTAGDYDIFLAKYDINGNYLWAKGIGGSGSEQGLDIALDGNGNPYMAGYFTSDTTWFNGNNANGMLTTLTGDQEAFLAKYDTAGNYQWAKAMGGSSSNEQLEGVAVNVNGDIYGSGAHLGTSDFNPGGSGGTLSMMSMLADGYLLKLSCGITDSTLAVSTCQSSYTLNDSVYTNSGTYTQVFPNAYGCDSTVTLELTLYNLEQPVITVNGFILGTTQPYATYQWILNGAAIPGATNATYTVSENGDYQVAVTSTEGCNDTSAIYTVTNATGLENIPGIAGYIKVYPNPAKDVVYIESPVPVNAALTAVDGKVIIKTNHTKSLSLSGLAEGVYFLQLRDKDNHLLKVEKIVKQQ